ncbi:MAG TPA: Ig-like domain-containing protein [Chitinophagaceae bacterium]|nr:Ig-like domain-containing protein [Chitinophagaceae bacterium]
MAWEECVTSIRQNLDPNAKEIGQVIWTGPNAQVTQEQLSGDTFAASKPFALICPDRHCTDNADFSPQAHALCNCKDVNGNPIPGCIPKNALYPFASGVCLNIDTKEWSTKRGRNCIIQGDSYYPLTCFCCCSCYANGTRIAIPTGFRAIEYFQTGDAVLTASYSSKDNKLSWMPATVKFSMGTGDDGHQSNMVYLHYGDDDRQIIVTPDQLFLLTTGELCRADRLVPGADQLMNEWGKPVDIHEISIGEYNGGVHHISTSTEYSNNIDGHLLLSEGVVTGDFLLQTSAQELIGKGVMRDHKDLPKVGSDAYDKKHKKLVKEYYGVTMTTVRADGKKEIATKPQRFYMYGARSISIPDTAAAYLDEAQAEDVYNNAPRWDFNDIGVNTALVKYVIQLFNAFYPDITFYYDQANVTPNAYAFNVAGKPIIVLTGGMARLKSLEQEGLSFILSHMISASQRAAPTGNNGWTSVAMADYYSVAILMNVYFGKNFGTMYMPGIRQLNDCIFKWIDEKNDKYVNDPYQPTIEKRFDAIDAGKAMDFPPDGIGGPTAGGLKVVNAKTFVPMVGMLSFVSQDIDQQQSIDAYGLLVKQKLVSDTGEVSADFNINTDLDFLFKDITDKDERLMMIGDVRSILLHAPTVIELEFNTTVNPSSASSKYNYSLTEGGTVVTAQAKVNIPVVEITAELKRGTEYTLTVSNYVRSSNGSTLDPAQSTAKVKIA